MTRNLRLVSLLMISAALTACGGGGGGGGGSTDKTNTPISISNATFGRAAALVVQTVNVGESPNYNEGFPAAAVGVSLPAVSAFTLSRAYVGEMKSAQASGTVLPVGITTPVPVTCKSGSGTKTFSNGAGTADPITVHAVGDTLDITYSNCVIDLINEGNNCISPTSPLKNIKLNGRVLTTITGYRSATDFDILLAYSSLAVTNAAGNATDTLNGSIAVTQSGVAPNYNITVQSALNDTLRTTSSNGVTQTLSATAINLIDTQLAPVSCTAPVVPNNDYVIQPKSHGRVASSADGYVNFNVDTVTKGNSNTKGGGFPDSGLITITGEGATFMTIAAVGTGLADVKLNGAATKCKIAWDRLFLGDVASCTFS